jgi:hypothetical protein
MRTKASIFSILLIFVLSACNSSTPTIVSTSENDTQIATQTFTATFTPTRTSTPTATQTFSPTSTATITPTVDLAHFSTLTPSEPEVCVPEFIVDNPPPIDWTPLLNDPTIMEEIIIIPYLNNYGPDALKRNKGINTEEFIDLTNDSVEELITYSGLLSKMIVGCRDGKYQKLFDLVSIAIAMPGRVEFIADVNNNGIPEIIFNNGYWSQGGHSYTVFEWDGTTFKNIVAERETEDSLEGALIVNATGRIGFRDTDGDGIQELILHSGIYYGGGDISVNSGPWRDRVDTYSWDGYIYIFLQEKWAPPKYRFQAVQDGDRFFSNGEYENALAMYQQAVTSETLLYWTPEIRDYLFSTEWVSLNDATLVPYPAEDKNEYIALSAYSYFRIMLLHLVEGRYAVARDIYQLIQNKYTDQTGKYYAELASVFWEEYSRNEDITSGCKKAVIYAQDHEIELIPYIGNSANVPSNYHGEQSLDYHPKDICPVK